MNPRVLGVIPARIGSSRLPRKPLHRLAGRPLIEWVWRRVLDADVCERVVIATDSDEVAREAASFGAEVAETSPVHPSGTDRVAELAAREEFHVYPIILNVQGDEPFVQGEHLEQAVALVAHGGWEIGTVAAALETLEAWRDAAVVKVVRDDRGGALLFSRAPIPFVRDGEPDAQQLADGLFLRHIGIYSYRREALARWVELPEGELERLERLEQLRPLAAGMRIGVALVEAATEGGVDTPADAARAELRLRHEFPLLAKAIV